ncbi:MAG: hypothetical protein QOE62_2858 [Actinomycetota bacterium]|nr:hypothetical protein [Actinomycetota bacterium]
MRGVPDAVVDDDGPVLGRGFAIVGSAVARVVGEVVALDALRVTNTPMAMATTNPMTTAKPI